MILQNQFRLRLRCAVGADPGSVQTNNVLTSKAPATWNHNPLRVEAALLDSGASVVQTDFTNVIGMICSIYDAQADNAQPPLVDKGLNITELNTALTQADWDAGDDQHGVFVFSGEEMTFALGKAKTKPLWLEVQYVPADGSMPVTVWAGGLTIYQNRIGGTTPIPNPPVEGLTRAEALATFVQIANPTAQAGFNMPDVGVDPSGETIYAVRLNNGVLERADEPGGTPGYIAVARLQCYDVGKGRNSIGRLNNGRVEWSD